MDRDGFRALTPWSFFLPIAAAVALGVLVANGLGAMVFGTGGDAGDAQQVQADGAEADGDGHARENTPASGMKASAASGNADAIRVDGGREANAPAALEPVRLPGPTAARRDGLARACIGGTIAVRASNGWEQEVVEDAPARCVAASP